jgi:hypothetical protein
VKHEWEDAWILLSVLYAGQHGSFSSLSQVIAAADFINHAIPTLGELDGALFRLRRAGWVEIQDLSICPSPRAHSMFSERHNRRTTVPKDLELVRQRINARDWAPNTPLPKPPRRPRVAGLTGEELAAAVSEYIKRMAK